jgi:beta-glucosidase
MKMFLSVALLLLLAHNAVSQQSAPGKQPVVTARSARVLELEGLQFKDLNKNGKLDVYEDWRQSPQARARDLVQQMTLEEKAGAMMHGTARTGGPMGAVGIGGSYDLEQMRKAIGEGKINSFITRLQAAARQLAEENNQLQQIAEESRLGIPLTISTDPRHHFQDMLGASSAGNGFSQWPETLGFAAIDDVKLMQRFGDIARQEYRAVGIHEALSPQADLATEPRWGRIAGTFGEDAQLARRMVQAYVIGFQNGARGLNAGSVITVVKHWVGYGAQPEGFDGHNAYGKYASFPKNNLPYHITPFTGAFAANVAGVMPTYPILRDVKLNGKAIEQVGAGFSRQLLTEELRGRYKFNGVIVSDWAITNDCAGPCVEGLPPGQPPSPAYIGMPWGVENLSRAERFVKGVNAGLDQFGGTEDSHILVEAIKAGKLTEARLDESAWRIMLQKFQQGLFENPYVDAAQAEAVAGNAAFVKEALAAQSRSLVLLENKNKTLPLNSKVKKLYLYKINPQAARDYGFTVVEKAEDADLALIRASAPFETLHPNYFFGSLMHEGDLGFHDGNADYEAIKAASAKVPTVVTIYLDRPAILTNVKDKVAALIGNFGVSDAALFDVLTGKAAPQGKLPFELPSSMDEVKAQSPDVPYDTAHPLYRFGFRVKWQSNPPEKPLFSVADPHSIEGLNLVGAAVSMPPFADSIFGVDSAFRRALFEKGLLLRFISLPRVSLNLLDGPVPASQQVYIGQRPTWIGGLNPILTADLRQLGLRNAQLNISAGWRWTNWNPAGPKALALSSLYLYKMWGKRRVEMKAGYLTNDLEFVGMQVGGSMATAAQGVYAVLPFEVGMSFYPLASPSLNLRLRGPGHTYLKTAAQRSLDAEGAAATEARNPTGFRFMPKGDKLLLINEVGYQRAASPTARYAWLRAGYLRNSTLYTNKITGLKEAGNYSAYVLADYQLRAPDEQAPGHGLYIGGSVMTVPARFNAYSRYYEARLYQKAPFPSRPDDVLSFVAAYRGHSEYVTSRLVAQGKPVWHSSPSITGTYSAHVIRGNYLTLGLGYVRGAAITPRVADTLTLSASWGLYF